MQRLTQTRPDNCWQTCVAMLTGRAVDSLPVQHEFSTRDAYTKALRVFLDKHFGLTYVEVEPYRFGEVKSLASKHVIIGETVRTGIEGAWHAIVGIAGEPYWDVHPSRAGLTEIRAWGLLVPTPADWRMTWLNEFCACQDCVSSSSTGKQLGSSTYGSER